MDDHLGYQKSERSDSDDYCNGYTSCLLYTSRCAMLKDANHSYFAGVYIVCGYTDLLFGIDSLASIIERRFHMNLFVPNTLFLFCGRSSTKIKGLLWEGNGLSLIHIFEMKTVKSQIMYHILSNIRRWTIPNSTNFAVC